MNKETPEISAETAQDTGRVLADPPKWTPGPWRSPWDLAGINILASHEYRVRRDAILHLTPPRPTEREIQVLGLAGSGLSNQEISDTLNISPGTVKEHLRQARGILRVHGRVGDRVWLVTWWHALVTEESTMVGLA